MSSFTEVIPFLFKKEAGYRPLKTQTPEQMFKACMAKKKSDGVTPVGLDTAMPDKTGGASLIGVTLNTMNAYLRAINVKEKTVNDFKKGNLEFKYYYACAEKNFWNSSMANKIKNQSLANFVFFCQWGSGYGFYRRMYRALGLIEKTKATQELVDAINNAPSKRDVYEKLYKARLDYLYDRHDGYFNGYRNGMINNYKFHEKDNAAWWEIMNEGTPGAYDIDANGVQTQASIANEYKEPEIIKPIGTDNETLISTYECKRIDVWKVSELDDLAQKGFLKYKITYYDKESGIYGYEESVYKIYEFYDITTWFRSARGFAQSPPEWAIKDGIKKAWDDAVVEYQKTNAIKTDASEAKEEMEKIEEDAIEDEKPDEEGISEPTMESIKEEISSAKENIKTQIREKAYDTKEAIIESYEKATDIKTVTLSVKETLKMMIREAMEKCGVPEASEERALRNKNEDIKRALNFVEPPLTDEEDDESDDDITPEDEAMAVYVSDMLNRGNEIDVTIAKNLLQMDALRLSLQILEKDDNTDEKSSKRKIRKLKRYSLLDIDTDKLMISEILKSLIPTLCSLITMIIVNIEMMKRMKEEQKKQRKKNTEEAKKQNNRERGNGQSLLEIEIPEIEIPGGEDNGKQEDNKEKPNDNKGKQNKTNEKQEGTEENEETGTSENKDEKPQDIFCKISLCDNDTDTISEIKESKNIIIEFDKNERYSITVRSGQSIKTGDEIGSINGIKIKSRVDLTVTRVFGNIIMGTKTQTNEIGELPQITVTDTSETDEISEIMTKYGESISFIKDVALLSRIPTCANRQNRNGEYTEIHTTDECISDLIGRYKNERDSFNSDIEKVCGSRNVKKKSSENKMDELKNEILTNMHTHTDRIISMYRNEPNMELFSDGNKFLLPRYTEALYEMVIEPENRFTDKFISELTHIIARRYDIESGDTLRMKLRNDIEDLCGKIYLLDEDMPESFTEKIDEIVKSKTNTDNISDMTQILNTVKPVIKEITGNNDVAIGETAHPTVDDYYASENNEEPKEEVKNDDNSQMVNEASIKFTLLKLITTEYEKYRNGNNSMTLDEMTEDDEKRLCGIINEAISAYTNVKDGIISGKIMSKFKSDKWDGPSPIIRKDKRYGAYSVTVNKENEYPENDDNKSKEMATRLYWLQYLSIATLSNCSLPPYWATGFVAPSGPVRLPIVTFPIFVIDSSMTVVMGIGICGTYVYPLIIYCNMSEQSMTILQSVNQIISRIKSAISSFGTTSTDSLLSTIKEKFNAVNATKKEDKDRIKKINDRLTKLRNSNIGVEMKKSLDDKRKRDFIEGKSVTENSVTENQ